MLLNFWEKDFEKLKNILNLKNSSSSIEETYIKKTVKYIKFIRFIPWLKMVAIWNSVAMNGANENSDIDLFIITSPNRLWIVRILITFIFQILWVRKTKDKHKARFCLSFFITTNNLNFKKFAIDNDIYLYYWMIYLKPILNYDNTWEHFIEENKIWCDFNEYQSIIEDNKKYIVYKKKTSNYNSFLLNYIEKSLKFFFLPKTKKSFLKLWKPFWVVITNNILKFHNNDRRKEIRDSVIHS